MITNPLLKKIVLGFSIFFILLCPLLFLAGMFAPRTLSFLDPIMCPEGSHISNFKHETLVPTGPNNVSNVADATDLICVNEQGEYTSDITGKMLIVLFSLGFVGVSLWLSTQKIERVS